MTAFPDKEQQCPLGARLDAAWTAGDYRFDRGWAIDRPAVDLPVFHGTGVMPGVDLNDSAALLDLMKKDDGPA